MASVRKREWLHNGEKRSAWVVEYTDQSGARRRKTPPSGLKKDADRLRQKIEQEIEGGVHTATSESATVSEAAGHFIRECYRRHSIGDMVMGSVRDYEWKLTKKVVPEMGRRKLADLTANDWQRFVDGLRAKYSPAFVHGIYRTIQAVMTFAVKRRWIRRNILNDEPCRLPIIERSKVIPSKADIKTMLDYTSNVVDGRSLLSCTTVRCIVALGVFAGLRPGESFGLQWGDVDFEKRVLRIRHNHTLADGLKKPKTASGIRDIPMSQPVHDALMQAARYWTIHKLASRPGYASYESGALFARIRQRWSNEEIVADLGALSGFVLLSKVHKPIAACGSGSSLWGRFMTEIGLVDAEGRSKFSMHALRHANVSLLIEAGLPAMNLKALIGHASVRTTYDVYGHLFDDDPRTLSTVSQIASSFVDATRMRQEQATV